jgi:hypothetical protein
MPRKKQQKKKVTATQDKAKVAVPILNTVSPQVSKASFWKHFGLDFARHETLIGVGNVLGALLSPFSILTYILSAYAIWVSTFQTVAGYLVGNPLIALVSLVVLILFAPLINGGVKGALRLLIAGIKKLFAPAEHAPVVHVPALALSNVKEVKEEAEADLLARYTGVRSFSPHLTKRDKKDDWNQCKENIKIAKDLRILGATGWDTFGDTNSPLHHTLDKFAGEIKILLLDPNASSVIKMRAIEVGKTEVEYVNDINRAIGRLKTLKHSKPGFNVELRLHTKPLIWKMIICNTYMWLQHYWPDKNVEDTPVYTFFSDGTEHPTSLFHPFYGEWQRLWKESTPFVI